MDFSWNVLPFPERKKLKIISHCQSLEHILSSECLCDIFYMHSVWHVVCNCLCLTIHHRVVFPHTLFSPKLVLSSAEKAKKTFSKSFWQVVFILFKAYITNFLERDCVGGRIGRKRHYICQAGKQSRQIALSCQRVSHRQNTEVPPWENEKHCTDTKACILYKLCFYAHLFLLYLNLTCNFATNVSKMQQH